MDKYLFKLRGLKPNSTRSYEYYELIKQRRTKSNLLKRDYLPPINLADSGRYSTAII